MGTYTSNYNLFMPTVGETGWGELVNGNFTTIDTTMKSLSNRITAVENEVNGDLSCTSVTTSGKVTANGGLSTKALTATTGTFSGAVTGTTFNGVVIKTSGTCTVTPTSTLRGYIEQSESNSVLLLPPRPGILYSGSIKAKNVNTSGTLTLSITAYDPVNGEDIDSPSVGIGNDTTLTFTNFPYLKIWKGNNNASGKYYDFKIT